MLVGLERQDELSYLCSAHVVLIVALTTKQRDRIRALEM